MKQDQLRADVMEEFQELNANIEEQKRELLAANEAQTDELLQAQAENMQTQLQVMEDNRLRLQQQQGKMMESIQCNTELQYEKMLVALDEQTDQITTHVDESFLDMKHFVVAQNQEVTAKIEARMDGVEAKIGRAQEQLEAGSCCSWTPTLSPAQSSSQ